MGKDFKYTSKKDRKAITLWLAYRNGTFTKKISRQKGNEIRKTYSKSLLAIGG